ncbi:MAG: periplasmic heavy metal sensor [Verrucomicrobia bacterium]|nr:periplasmic heavy metal sensor [Verrucomicrobiota bacterium]
MNPTRTSTPVPLATLLAVACIAALPATAQDRPGPQRDDPQRPRDGAPPRGEFQQRPPQNPPRDGQPRDNFRPEGQPRDGFRPQGQPGEGFRPGGQGQGQGQGQGPANFMADLTEEQRNAVREIMGATFQNQREANESLMTARREMNELLTAPKFDEKAIRDKVMAIAKMDADMAVLRAKAFAEVRKQLGTDVAEKLKPMFMGGPGMGGPGMGGPRPGGFQQQPGGEFRRPQGEPGQPPREGEFRRPQGGGQPGDAPRPGGDRFNDRRPGGNNPPQPPRDGEPRRPGSPPANNP